MLYMFIKLKTLPRNVIHPHCWTHVICDISIINAQHDNFCKLAIVVSACRNANKEEKTKDCL